MSHSIITDTTNGYDPLPRHNQWIAQFGLYKSARIDSTILDSTFMLASFVSNAAGSRFQWLTDIEFALGISDTAAAKFLLDSPVVAMGRVVVDTNIVITDISEADYIVDEYVAFYNEYLKLLKGDSPDLSLILSIAEKCPALYGDVVYQARSLYHRISHQVIVYNDESCAYGGGGYRLAPMAGESEESQQYSLYPNPNEGSFVIKQTHIENKLVDLKVYNAIGALVYQAQGSFVNGQCPVKMEQKSPGIYLVCIGDKDLRTACLRFMIKL